MLAKKQIWVIFLFEFKMGHIASETIHNINNAFDPGTAKKCTVQWWFSKFCKEDESLEDEEQSGRRSEVDSDQLWGYEDNLAETSDSQFFVRIDSSSGYTYMGEIYEIMLNEKAGNEKEYMRSWYEIYKNHLCRHPRWEEKIRGESIFP